MLTKDILYLDILWVLGHFEQECYLQGHFFMIQMKMIDKGIFRTWV